MPELGIRIAERRAADQLREQVLRARWTTPEGTPDASTERFRRMLKQHWIDCAEGLSPRCQISILTAQKPTFRVQPMTRTKCGCCVWISSEESRFQEQGETHSLREEGPIRGKCVRQDKENRHAGCSIVLSAHGVRAARVVCIACRGFAEIPRQCSRSRVPCCCQ